MGVLKNFDVAAVRREQAAIGREDFNCVRPGLNYSGICKNSKCVAFQHVVVAPRGFGEYIVNDDIVCGQCVCPGCSQSFDMAQLVLYQCRATARLLSQTENAADYVADRDGEFIILGSQQKGNSMLTPDALLTVVTRKLSSGCVVA